MNQENSPLIHFLGDNPMMRIVDFLIENKGFDYSKEDIAMVQVSQEQHYSNTGGESKNSA